MASPDQALQLTNAINALATAIAGFTAPPPAPAAAAKPPVHHLFSSTAAFDLSTRSGENAFKQMCEPLSHRWDGSPNYFSLFIAALELRSTIHWNDATNNGIMKVVGKDLLTKYHDITDANITAACIGRTDNRALQNARALFKCLKSSVK